MQTDNKLKKESVEFLILFFLLILGFLLRVYKIDNPVADWHSWRQADTASVTREFLKGKVNLLFPKYHDISSVQTGYFNPQGYRFVEFPIYNFLHYLLFKYLPIFNLEIWGRLLSIYSSLFSSIVLYLIAKRFLGKSGGVVCVFIFLVLPFNIYFSRVILPEPLSLMFGLASLWFFLLFIDGRSLVFLFLSSIFLSLGILTKPFIIFFLIPIIYLYLSRFGVEFYKDFKTLTPFLVFLDISLVPFFLWRAWMNKFPQGIPFFLWAFNGDGIRFKPSFWRWIFGERVGHLILGSWGLIPFIFGFFKEIKRKEKFFFHFFLLGMFLYVTILATANVRHDYYQTIIIPSIVLFVSSGIIFMWKEQERLKLRFKFLTLFSLLIMFSTTWPQIREFYKINHPEIIEAGSLVDRTIPKEAIIIAPYNGDTAFLYQTKRKGFPILERPVQELKQMGANFYVSVNFDQQTLEIMNNYKVIKKTDRFVLVDLRNF